MEHSKIAAIRLAQLWELVAQKTSPSLLNYAQFAFLMKAALHSIPVENISPALRQELDASVDERVMQQIVKDLMPFLGGGGGATEMNSSTKQETISLAVLIQLEKKVALFVSGSCTTCPTEPIPARKAVILLYCAKMDIWLSPFMETEIMRAFCRIGKEWLRREIACISSQNDRLREEIHSKSKSFSSPATAERKKELEEIKKSISVKELTSRLHAASLRSNSSSVSSPVSDVGTRDHFCPFYSLNTDSCSSKAQQDDSSTLCTSSANVTTKEGSSLSEFHLSSSRQNSQPISYVKALYAYEKKEDDELTFERDSLIAVLRKGPDEWWQGENAATRDQGWFPSNYVQELEKCTVIQNYSNQLVKERIVWSCEHAAEWFFVYVPECEWHGIVPGSILDTTTKKSAVAQATTSATVCTAANRNEKQHAVISELISSENRYIHNLSLMVQFYYKPIRSMSSGWSDSEVTLLFSNSCDILEASISFGNELALCENGMMVAKLFSEASFEPYVKYCINQSEAIEYYMKRLKIDASFAALIQETKKQPELKGMDLCGFLLEPMQRITRYPLLLKQLIKYTENKSEIENLTLALEKTESILSKINAMIQEREREAKLKELNSRLVTTGHQAYQKHSLDLTRPTKGMGKRILLLDGTPTRVKAGSGSGKKCHVYLFNDMLLICSRAKANSSASIEALREPISTAQIRLANHVPHASAFVTDICYEATAEAQEIISLYWTSKSEKSAWTAAIELALEAVKVAQITQIERSVTLLPKVTSVTDCMIEVRSGKVSMSANNSKATATAAIASSKVKPVALKPWRHSLVFVFQPGHSPKRTSKPVSVASDGKLAISAANASNNINASTTKLKWNNYGVTNRSITVQVAKWEPWSEDLVLAEKTFDIGRAGLGVGSAVDWLDEEVELEMEFGEGYRIELSLHVSKRV